MEKITLLLFAVLLAAKICRTECQTQTNCPVVRCARPDCPETDWIQQYFGDDERCPACMACGEMCRDIACAAVIPPCKVQDRIREVMTVRGEKCFGCTQCKDKTPEVKTDCPVYGCVDPGCNNPKRTFFTLDDGTRCEGCPKCRKRDVCPAVKCKAKRCPRGTVKKRKYKRINGVRCKMCYKCVTKKNRKN